MAARKLPDIAFVRECLRYNPATGLFIWRKRPLSHFANPRGWWQWNGRYPGTLAGSTKGRPVRFFRVIRIDGETFYAHRLAWLLHHRADPWPHEIDHIDGDALNNRIRNLRLATSSQNHANRRRTSRATQTGVKGVTIHRDGYVACLWAEGRRHYLGRFQTVEDAAKAYRKASKVLHGEFHAARYNLSLI